ncbi:MAG: hypothetical protein IKS96_02720 [Fibrobacter sp.]|nr:hypothetical protein [Fibrobacter sp.]
MVQLETLRYHFADTVKMVTRTIVVRQSSVDTTAAASSELRSDLSAGSSETTTTTPLTVQSKKKGLAWLCPVIVFGCLIFFVIFLSWISCIKKN